MPKPTTHRTTDPDATPARRRWALDGWAYGAAAAACMGDAQCSGVQTTSTFNTQCSNEASSFGSPPRVFRSASTSVAPRSGSCRSSGRRRRRKRTCCWCPGSKRKCSQEAPVTRLQDHHNTQDHQVHAAHGVNRSSCSHWVSFDKMC